MKRKINFTGRKKILRSEAVFRMTDESVFDVELDFKSNSYPEGATVYIEAYNGETRQRYNFGTINDIEPPSNRKLDELDLSGTPKFKICIVDHSAQIGKILAIGEQFTANSDDDSNQNKASLLPIKTRPLLQETWKVEFEPGERPVLYLNNAIENAIEKMRTDRTFQSLIFPAALRQILTYFLWNEEDELDNEFFGRWMDFASLYCDPRPIDRDVHDDLCWINSVVSRFCDSHSLADKLVSAGKGEI
jgi:hypothetical protein